MAASEGKSLTVCCDVADGGARHLVIQEGLTELRCAHRFQSSVDEADPVCDDTRIKSQRDTE